MGIYINSSLVDDSIKYRISMNISYFQVYELFYSFVSTHVFFIKYSIGKMLKDDMKIIQGIYDKSYKSKNVIEIDDMEILQ